MKLSIPMQRSFVRNLLRACWQTLLGHKVTVEFECDGIMVDGDRPILMSREQAKELQQRHLAAAAKAALLEDLLKGALEEASSDNPLAMELKDGLAEIEGARTLH